MKHLTYYIFTFNEINKTSLLLEFYNFWKAALKKTNIGLVLESIIKYCIDINNLKI